MKNNTRKENKSELSNIISNNKVYNNPNTKNKITLLTQNVGIFCAHINYELTAKVDDWATVVSHFYTTWREVLVNLTEFKKNDKHEKYLQQILQFHSFIIESIIIPLCNVSSNSQSGAITFENKQKLTNLKQFHKIKASLCEVYIYMSKCIEEFPSAYTYQLGKIVIGLILTPQFSDIHAKIAEYIYSYTLVRQISDIDHSFIKELIEKLSGLCTENKEISKKHIINIPNSKTINFFSSFILKIIQFMLCNSIKIDTSSLYNSKLHESYCRIYDEAYKNTVAMMLRNLLNLAITNKQYQTILTEFINDTIKSVDCVEYPVSMTLIKRLLLTLNEMIKAMFQSNLDESYRLYLMELFGICMSHFISVQTTVSKANKPKEKAERTHKISTPDRSYNQIRETELVTSHKLERLNLLDIPEVQKMYIEEKEIILKYYDTQIIEQSSSLECNSQYSISKQLLIRRWLMLLFINQQSQNNNEFSAIYSFYLERLKTPYAPSNLITNDIAKAKYLMSENLTYYSVDLEENFQCLLPLLKSKSTKIKMKCLMIMESILLQHPTFFGSCNYIDHIIKCKIDPHPSIKRVLMRIVKASIKCNEIYTQKKALLKQVTLLNIQESNNQVSKLVIKCMMIICQKAADQEQNDLLLALVCRIDERRDIREMVVKAFHKKWVMPLLNYYSADEIKSLLDASVKKDKLQPFDNILKDIITISDTTNKYVTDCSIALISLLAIYKEVDANVLYILAKLTISMIKLKNPQIKLLYKALYVLLAAFPDKASQLLHHLQTEYDEVSLASDVSEIQLKILCLDFNPSILKINFSNVQKAIGETLYSCPLKDLKLVSSAYINIVKNFTKSEECIIKPVQEFYSTIESSMKNKTISTKENKDVICRCIFLLGHFCFAFDLNKLNNFNANEENIHLKFYALFKNIFTENIFSKTPMEDILLEAMSMIWEKVPALFAKEESLILEILDSNESNYIRLHIKIYQLIDKLLDSTYNEGLDDALSKIVNRLNDRISKSIYSTDVLLRQAISSILYKSAISKIIPFQNLISHAVILLHDYDDSIRQRAENIIKRVSEKESSLIYECCSSKLRDAFLFQKSIYVDYNLVSGFAKELPKDIIQDKGKMTQSGESILGIVMINLKTSDRKNLLKKITTELLYKQSDIKEIKTHFLGTLLGSLELSMKEIEDIKEKLHTYVERESETVSSSLEKMLKDDNYNTSDILNSITYVYCQAILFSITNIKESQPSKVEGSRVQKYRILTKPPEEGTSLYSLPFLMDDLQSMNEKVNRKRMRSIIQEIYTQLSNEPTVAHTKQKSKRDRRVEDKENKPKRKKKRQN